MRVAEREFVQIPRQMLFAAMLVDAFHAAFEHREEILNRLRVHVAARPFLFRMVTVSCDANSRPGRWYALHSSVISLLFVSACVFKARRSSADVAPFDRHRPRPAAALYQSEDRNS